MPRASKTAIVAWLLLTSTTIGRAGQVHGALDLLKKVRETYCSLKSFQFEGITVSESQGPGTQTRTEFPFEGAFVAPYKMRIETKNAFGGILFVSDGRTLWTYVPTSKTYSRIDYAKLKASTSAEGDAETGLANFSGFWGAAGVPFDVVQWGIAQNVMRTNMVHEEVVELAGNRLQCYVVEAEYGPPAEDADAFPFTKTYWIDKVRLVVLREIHEGRLSPKLFGRPMSIKYTTVLKKVSLNATLPDDLFVFVPPEGVKEGEPNQIGLQVPVSPD